MRQIKSERLKKLEQELHDLEQWQRLGLVPKKDIDRHQDEIEQARSRIEEEKERLQFLKESGEVDDYVAPKRTATRTAYTDMPTLPDIDAEGGGNATANNTAETSFEMGTEAEEADSTKSNTIVERTEEADVTFVEEDEESIFSDKNRWLRAKDIVDPEASEW